MYDLSNKAFLKAYTQLLSQLNADPSSDLREERRIVLRRLNPICQMDECSKHDVEVELFKSDLTSLTSKYEDFIVRKDLSFIESISDDDYPQLRLIISALKASFDDYDRFNLLTKTFTSLCFFTVRADVRDKVSTKKNKKKQPPPKPENFNNMIDNIFNKTVPSLTKKLGGGNKEFSRVINDVVATVKNTLPDITDT